MGSAAWTVAKLKRHKKILKKTWRRVLTGLPEGHILISSPEHTGNEGMGIPMNITADTATAIITDARDNDMDLTVRLVDGTEVTGAPISVNSKGVNLKVDGKVRSFGLKRITALVTDEDLENESEVADRMEELANEVSDGASTAEVAALLSDYLNRDVAPKELRVHLRALGLGVGKGRKYALSAGEFRAVVKVIEATPVNA